VLSEEGELALVRATPDQLTENVRARLVGILTRTLSATSRPKRIRRTRTRTLTVFAIRAIALEPKARLVRMAHPVGTARRV